MPSFLTPEWFTALDAALSGIPLADAEPFTPFTLRHVVTDLGSGAVLEYRVTLSDREIRVSPGPGGSDPTADLVFVTDYDTAAALNRGEVSAQEALESGRLEVRGRLDRVTGARKLLVALADATRELRATTTYAPRT